MPMTITAERAEVVKFSEPFFQTVSLSILMKKPILQYHFFKFITVLEYSVWICITGAFFFTSVLLWVFDRMSPYSYQNVIPQKTQAFISSHTPFCRTSKSSRTTTRSACSPSRSRCGSVSHHSLLKVAVRRLRHSLVDWWLRLGGSSDSSSLRHTLLTWPPS